MQLKNSTAQILVPDGLPVEEALARTTHMGIGAHQDDLEIMAIDGILQCFQQSDKWFTGIIATNGGGSSRSGLYADYSDDDMRDVRNREQKKAAIVGEYAAQALLDYPSSSIKDAANQDPVDDILALIKIAKPQIVYVHNLADKHETHVGVALKVIKAIRQLPDAERPKHLYGCEVWRDLDWMMDADKIAFDVSAQEGVQNALVGIFDSQISGGKRYDLGTMGRRRANATYHASHHTDVSSRLVFAMDLTPLIDGSQSDIVAYVRSYIERFSGDVYGRLGRMI